MSFCFVDTDEMQGKKVAHRTLLQIWQLKGFNQSAVVKEREGNKRRSVRIYKGS